MVCVLSGSEHILSFGDYFFSVGFNPVPDDIQHDFTRVTDKVYNCVILAEL